MDSSQWEEFYWPNEFYFYAYARMSRAQFIGQYDCACDQQHRTSLRAGVNETARVNEYTLRNTETHEPKYW